MCSCSKAHQRTQSQMQPSCGALPAPGGWREAGGRPDPALPWAQLGCIGLTELPGWPRPHALLPHPERGSHVFLRGLRATRQLN